MDRQVESLGEDLAAVKQRLLVLAGDRVEPSALELLAAIIVEQARVAAAPLSSARIAQVLAHYERDHTRVHALQHDTAPEWTVVAELLPYLAARSVYPADAALMTALGPQIRTAIRQELCSYRFDSALDTWIVVRTARHFAHLWRV